jgi:hypothetical protein
VGFFKGFDIAHAKDAVTLRPQPFVAKMIVQLGVVQIMPSAIDLDNQLGGMLREIGNVATYGRLSANA